MQQNINTFQIKQNDTFPSLEIRLKSRSCLDSIIAFNLSAVTACTFSMADDCGNLKIASMTATISSYSGGCIQYDWVTGDTDTPGKYKAEFELYFSDGKKTTVPTLGVIEITILKDVNNI